MEKLELKYLQCLAELYPSIAKASTEIINLQSILNLPKATEHFLTDIHGEYEAFSHVLKNGSGAVRRKINEVFGHTLDEREKKSLATLIYYPKEKMEVVKKSRENMEDWYMITLYRLIEVCKRVASKYTRSKVRKALPEDFAYVIEELITEKPDLVDKEAYYDEIVHTIIEIGRAEVFIIALSELIQRLVVDHLHILGDIYDRGPGPQHIMDKLTSYHSLDIQWGNHDILWMGAAVGQRSCIATVIRICARYGNLDILEDGYGINLLPLATFALATYKNDPCECFKIKGTDVYNPAETELNMKMHKAISIIQFKLEGQLLTRHKEYKMSDRRLLDKIDYEAGTMELDGKTYALIDKNFPTIDPKKPFELTEEETAIMERLVTAFTDCEKLQQHMMLLLNKGGLYKTFNGNLLYHGCVPLNDDGSLMTVEIYGKKYKGKALYDVLDTYVRKAFFALNPVEREKGKDILWYIWSGPGSPLFGKSKMATLERYFLKEPETHKEVKNAYYGMLENDTVVNSILQEFGLDPEHGHIINGHVPVHHMSGESPVKCSGKLLVIDGGFSKAYQKETGIAGYTLIFNSFGLILAAHEPFTSAENAIAQETDIVSDSILVKRVAKRMVVGDTDNGKALKERIDELKQLLDAYRSGLIKEK
ncbi:fructose-bisphosphatase class III [Lactonifactor longoviformis]|uniref:Fructose-1,6-bisphosphatase class 3 n=1 Tax=Lactonifactor longoviformis DSM 17459 TaxID=1122155 RepID=A0A1M4ZYT4_9CLOT|nr:fructose-1,6-bisphosphatase [Lactonifactor longoviformis]POP34961.1 fructose-bisphosphatase class III [Lactonifactor longoviformis]SHF22997.1 fructose-1,6-bisphosphatase-3 [Lactonifactor longoviformis DSM 17459]